MDEGGDDFGQDDEGGGSGEEDGTDTEGGEAVADDEAWGELEDRMRKEGGAAVEKSLSKKRIVRIVV
jgi:hypothetical protein